MIKEPTPETSTAKRWRHALTPWLGVLVIWLVCNAVFLYATRTTPLNRNLWLIPQKWTIADELETTPDWLFLGDSSGNQGIDAALASEQLGGTAVNLCLVAPAGSVGDAFMLDRVKDGVGMPRHVALIHVFDFWTRPEPELNTIPTPVLAAIAPDSPADLSLDEKISLAGTQLFPVAGFHHSFAKFIKDPSVLTQTPASGGLIIHPDGFMPMQPVISNALEDDLNHHRSVCLENTPQISPANQRILDRLYAMTRHYDFNLYIVNAPLVREAYDDPIIRPFYDQINAQLTAWTSQSDRLHHLLAEPALYDKEQIYNLDHTVGEAAQDYTRKVCEALLKAKAK
jgi:hypothetical protein